MAKKDHKDVQEPQKDADMFDTGAPEAVEASETEGEHKAVAATADVAEEAPAVTRGRKSPLQILREEKAKTIAVKEQFEEPYQQAHEVAAEKKTGLPVKLENLRTELDEKAAERLRVSKESVDRFTKSVDARYKEIHSLEAQLKQALQKLQEEKKDLSGAQSTLRQETETVTKENSETFRTTEKELKADLKAAQAEEKAAKKALSSNVRKERMATVKNTVKGSLAYAFGLVAAVPDVIVRGVRSLYGMAAEALGTFNRVAKRSVKEYKKPTPFTKHRN